MTETLLHQRFPALKASLPRLHLGSGPTPVRELTHLPTAAGPVWLKDEGAYGDGGWGGNKVRKLEWLLADAVRRDRRTVITVGGLGTNWGLATARYGREHGLDTVLALVDQPVDDHVRAQLDRLRDSGARLYFTRTKIRTVAAAPLLLARYRRACVIPPGGSNAVGALGYVEMALELAEQIRAGALPRPGSIVVPVGSGGTAAGLCLGLELAGLADVTVTAIVVNDTLHLDQHTIHRLARRTATLLTARGADLPALQLSPQRLTVTRAWLGTGYGHPTPAALTALAVAKEHENLALEPVYTGKAMAAVLDLTADDKPGTETPVLFLNTNGPR
ncbi:1-aminocyclopropane-1-carboxylate deaminase/D-cysteine desulfhydrase [Rhodococcus oryzae]|uniref:1-aminocyclopropane-1-carboxylate deaminase/D-cysteine desulfhydrase n=1 Tax=Rhodococcus oryzae TaxID=2571143 RepID=UPI00371B9999